MGLMRQARVPAATRCVVSLALVCAISQAALAQTTTPKAQAQALFEEGRAAVEAGDCARAIPLFRRSQTTFPARGTLFNLAQCEAKLGRVASASQHFKELLTQLPPGDPRLPIAQKEVTDLEPRLPKLVLELAQGAPSPSEVLLDQTPLTPTSLGGELPVDPGDHVIVARWVGGGQTEARASLPEAARKVVRLEPPAASPSGDAPSPLAADANAKAPPAASPALAQEAGPAPAPASSGRRTLAFVVGGVGAAALGGSLIAGALALGTKGDLEDECKDPGACSPEGMDLKARGQTLTTTGTVLGAVGLAGIGAGLVLLLTAPEQGTSVALTPAILPGGGGAVLRSRF
ncbi:tetratricopeptide repeat protein [Sorangium sp. So ce131]|uniref:tetratricopeptide repeat protein n=1 Tax=Sorangium sp. So ce131 TaxID=3133282 RepID=UPI003F6140DD